MLYPRIIPCLDVSAGRVVKGVNFQSLRDAGDPVELAMLYETQGADELTLLDISATAEARRTALETVRAVRRELSIPLTVGGGVRTVEDVRNLLLAGADKISINSAALARPELIDELSDLFGSQCTVLAIDAKQRDPGSWEPLGSSGSASSGRCAVEWAIEACQRGAGEILLTSWDRDGSKSGFDLKLIEAIAGQISVPVIASGGGALPEHFARALEAGANAVLAASIFHFGDFEVSSLKQALQEEGIEVRI